MKGIYYRILRENLFCHKRTKKKKKSADQPTHPRSLISTFVVRYSRIFKTLVSSAEQTGLSLTWSQTTKTGFLVTKLISHDIFARQVRKAVLKNLSVGEKYERAVFANFYFKSLSLRKLLKMIDITSFFFFLTILSTRFFFWHC